IDEAYTNAALDEEEAKLQARAILRSIGFGDNNYIYAWTYDSINLAFRPNPSLEGPSRNSTPERKELLRNLIETGRNGQGFHAYDWVNPASGQPEPKISYSIDLPKWQWVIGAGIYVTDVDEAVAAAQLEIDEAIRASLQYILLTTLIIVVIAI